MAHYKGAASEAGRALQLQKKREKALEELEHRKRKIEEEMKLSNIGNKFATHYDAIEQQIKSSTIGLVTLDEMRAKQEDVVKERERQLALRHESIKLREIEERRKLKETQKRQIQTLSFRFDEEDNEDDSEESDEQIIKSETNEQKDDNTSSETNEHKEDNTSSETNEPKDGNTSSETNEHKDGNTSSETDEPKDGNTSSETVGSVVDSFNIEDFNTFMSRMTKKRKMMKNPDVDTSFLPDRHREDHENRLREKLRQEWVEKQEKLKNEDIEITFSYWDGSGHRRSVLMKKGNSIYQFLQKSLEILRKEFHELRAVTADQLMYIKEDLIIPHHYTFYDFIVTKARGKSGPLFSFDVHDDIRLIGDITVEKDESHAGKVLLRSWYERNKHIFPASRWEPYDPTKNYDKYTISDRKK